MDIKCIQTRNYGTNCYLLKNENSVGLVDAGEWDKRIEDFVKENLNVPNKYIFLTHCHFDHIGFVPWVQSLWNAKIICLEDEKEGLLNNKINLSGIWTDSVISITPDITLKDNEIVDFGGEKIRVIKISGHTKGSCAYLWKNVLFSGDTLFRLSIGRTDLPTADYPQMQESLYKLSKLDKDTIVLPGHGKSTTIGFETENNIYL